MLRASRSCRHQPIRIQNSQASAAHYQQFYLSISRSLQTAAEERWAATGAQCGVRRTRWSFVQREQVKVSPTATSDRRG